MEARRTRKGHGAEKDFTNSGLSLGVAGINAKPLDRKGSKFMDAVVNVLLFFLGGIILCGMIYALITFT